MEHPIFIHLLADFDHRSAKHSIYQALLSQFFPQARIIYSNQDFKKGDMMAPGIFLKLVYPHFPVGCFHICTLQMDSRLPEKYILARAAGQFFLGPDNGFLPIALGGEDVAYFKLAELVRGSDVLKSCFIPQLLQIVSENMQPTSLIPEEKPRKYLLPAPTITGNIWRLMVLYNDADGNAYLNMEKEEFERITAGKNFRIRLGHKDSIETLSLSYHDVQEGNKLAIFGLGNLLQIAINSGSAMQYLGLKQGSMVMMEIV